MACKAPMKHQVSQYLNILQISHPSVSLCNFLWIILKHGKLYPQVSLEKKPYTWEQHRQRDSSDKENKSTSLRNNDCFEAWKRKQEHHPSVPLVSQVETKQSRNSALHPLSMQAARNSELRTNKTQQQETLSDLAVNYFTGSQHLEDLCSQEVSPNLLSYFLIFKSFSNTLPANLQTSLFNSLTSYFYLNMDRLILFCATKSGRFPQTSAFVNKTKQKVAFFPVTVFFLTCLEILQTDSSH